jgi:murein DD-endopeptidase MepM/ murein hydrolase activator NlpD
MKPLRLLLPALLATPALAPLVSVFAVDSSASSSADEISLVLSGEKQLNSPPFPEDFDDRNWVPVPQMAEIPADSLASASQGTKSSSTSGGDSGDSSTRAVVRLGDTLLKIAQRHGITLTELLRLNPGLQTARLVVGSQLRVANSATPRVASVIGLKPVGSGGISWPELPQYEGDGRTTSPPSGKTISRQWIWPTKGVFTSGYGWRWGRMHKGIDVANNVGTPIVAAREGQVTFSGWSDGGYGYLVEIAHPDGSRSLYAHNSRLMVRKGDVVGQGQTISLMGSTGRSTGPHLHFEIHPAGRGASNPMQFLPPRA